MGALGIAIRFRLVGAALLLLLQRFLFRSGLDGGAAGMGLRDFPLPEEHPDPHIEEADDAQQEAPEEAAVQIILLVQMLAQNAQADAIKNKQNRIVSGKMIP